MASGQIWKKILPPDHLLPHLIIQIHTQTLYPALSMGHYTAPYRQAE